MQKSRERQVRPPGREDPLEEEMAPHSSILTWETPWTEEPGGLWPMGSVRYNWAYAHTWGRTHGCRVFETSQVTSTCKQAWEPLTYPGSNQPHPVYYIFCSVVATGPEASAISLTPWLWSWSSFIRPECLFRRHILQSSPSSNKNKPMQWANLNIFPLTTVSCHWG